ncbi:high affinity methionine permease [Macrolepiota fuliginosa MF-IS2]|uniref:High affinity methionine permease n=1 Tax=Macrolepiota fuliginosa MF-IS2 TaxID=1400762 RepID=A0A9P5X956_9AGAR|nr:high affinity methionine permease [Macrolepiota fuliginosa MF-IS2]
MSSSESESLASAGVQHYGSIQQDSPAHHQKKDIGIVSAVFIIFNRIIGTGIFATPGAILALTGSVGLSLLLWLLGTLIAAAGMQTYIVWGTAFPKNGAEKNYLEYLFPKPAYLTTCIYAANSSLMGWAAGNSLVFGEYALKALLGQEPSSFVLKLTSFVCVTLAFLLHGTMLRWGLRLQNILGVFKLFVVAIVAATGFFALRNGITGGDGLPEDRWRGRENFRDIWKGTTASPASICLALYSVIWSFIGFSNANYAMSEMRDPARTIKIAGAWAIAVVAVLYLLSNVAYFAGASKDEIIHSGRLVVSLLMRNIWGEIVERWVNVGVACSALGNVLAVSFAQGRVNQELGKEGALPFSQLWASSWPFNAPLAGLALHWFFCVLIIFFVPPGDTYNFVINMASYPLTVINATISFGLIYLYLWSPLHTSEGHQYRWHNLSFITLASTAFFGIANLFLFIVPLTKPPPGAEPYEHLPYWIHAAAGWGLFTIGTIWWALRRGRGWDQADKGAELHSDYRPL